MKPIRRSHDVSVATAKWGVQQGRTPHALATTHVRGPGCGSLTDSATNFGFPRVCFVTEPSSTIMFVSSDDGVDLPVPERRRSPFGASKPAGKHPQCQGGFGVVKRCAAERRDLKGIPETAASVARRRRCRSAISNLGAPNVVDRSNGAHVAGAGSLAGVAGFARGGTPGDGSGSAGGRSGLVEILCVDEASKLERSSGYSRDRALDEQGGDTICEKEIGCSAGARGRGCGTDGA